MKKHIQDVNVPNIFDMVKKYKKTKGIKVEEEKEENGIQWDYKTPDENILKCRVDEINELNVLVQGSFMFDMNLAEEILTNCTTLFHSNNYPVVVIQNRNGGGYGQISIALAQILQVKILTRDYLSYKPLEFLREGYEQAPETFLNVDTCRPYPSFDDFLNGTVDEYKVGDEIIYHKKSKIIDLLDLNLRKYLEESRLQLNQTGKLKKPTEIMVFTDSFSYSATSVFIKALQDEGGAIIVGYNGNPKLGNEVFDASQSPAPVFDFSFTQEYENLKKLGIKVGGITFGEKFD
jgi:hypothetical protein